MTIEMLAGRTVRAWPEFTRSFPCFPPAPNSLEIGPWLVPGPVASRLGFYLLDGVYVEHLEIGEGATFSLVDRCPQPVLDSGLPRLAFELAADK